MRMGVGRINSEDGNTCITIACTDFELQFLRKFIEASIQMFNNIRSNPVMRAQIERQEKKAGHKGGFAQMIEAAQKLLDDLSKPPTDL